MILFAIDPGPGLSAWVIWDTETRDFIKDAYGHSCCGLVDNSKLFDYMSTLFHIGLPVDVDLVAIETPQNYGIAIGRSTLQTCIIVGQLVEICRRHGIACKLFGRPTIKGQIGGRTDAEIRTSLRMRFGESRKGEKLEGVKNDIWSALALATALTEYPNLKEW